MPTRQSFLLLVPGGPCDSTAAFSRSLAAMEPWAVFPPGKMGPSGTIVGVWVVALGDGADCVKSGIFFVCASVFIH